MGRIHQWYYLKDKEGRPIENASVNLYLTGTKTEATIYESATTSASFDQSTWLTPDQYRIQAPIKLIRQKECG